MSDPSFNVDDLTTPLTADEIKTSIYTTLATLGVSTTNWKPGAVVRTIIAAVALVLAALSQLVAAIARAGFLDTATGNWLTLLAYYVYDVTRIPATFATGNVTLTNAAGGIYNWNPGELQVTCTLTGKVYKNLALISLGVGPSSVTSSFIAEEIGADSTAFAGEIDALVVALDGVTCSNAAPLVGTDEESDPELRVRCRNRLGALSPNGPADAYDYIAKSATLNTGVSAGVTRVRTVPNGAGGITAYLANASGSLAGTVGDLSTPLGAADDAMQRQCVPLGITLTSTSAVGVSVPVTYDVWLYNTTSLTQAQIEDAIADSLAAWFAARPIGGDYPAGPPGALYRSGVEAAIGAARTSSGISLNIFRVQLTAPASDIVFAANECPVLGTVTPNGIHQVSP